MDDDRFYDDDDEMEDEPRGEADSRGPTGEYGKELYELLDFLTEILEKAGSVPLTNKRLVNVDVCLDIVKDIQDNLPDAVQHANQVLEERDRILYDAETTASAKLDSANARADSAIDEATSRAQRIISDAEDRAQKIEQDAEMRARAMVSQSEIMRHANEEATTLCNEARADANEQRLAATRYAEELLRDLERDLEATLDAVRRSRKNVDRGQ